MKSRQSAKSISLAAGFRTIELIGRIWRAPFHLQHAYLRARLPTFKAHSRPSLRLAFAAREWGRRGVATSLQRSRTVSRLRQGSGGGVVSPCRLAFVAREMAWHGVVRAVVDLDGW
jgi:hypothetical protein